MTKRLRNWFLLLAMAIAFVGCDDLLGPSDDAVAVEVTTCSGRGLGSVDVTIGGTVRATRSVSFVTVTGYANDQRLFSEDRLGSMDGGDVKAFTVTGRINSDLNQTSLVCRAEVSYSVD